MANDQEIRSLLLAALDSDFGIAVREAGGRAELLKQQLYRIRRTDSDFSCIAITESPDEPDTLFLLNKDKINDQTGTL